MITDASVITDLFHCADVPGGTHPLADMFHQNIYPLRTHVRDMSLRTHVREYAIRLINQRLLLSVYET